MCLQAMVGLALMTESTSRIVLHLLSLQGQQQLHVIINAGLEGLGLKDVKSALQTLASRESATGGGTTQLCKELAVRHVAAVQNES